MVKKKHSSARKSGGATSSGLMMAAQEGKFVGFSAFAKPAGLEATEDKSAARNGSKPAPSTLPPCYAGDSAEVAVACKSLAKRDATTKLKGMSELQRLFAGAAVGDATLAGLVPHFVFLYRRIALDNDRRVREALQQTLGVLAAPGRRALRSVMPDLIGPWWVAMSDPVSEVANAATEAWERAFAKPRRDEVLAENAKQLLAHLAATLQQQPDTLSDLTACSGQEADERHERVLLAALAALGRLVDAAVATSSAVGNCAAANGEEDSEYVSAVAVPLGAAEGFASGELSVLLASDEPWRRLSDPVPAVRRAAYALLSFCCSRAPSLLRPQQLAASSLGALGETEAGNHAAMWEAVLLFTKAFPVVWEKHAAAPAAAFAKLLLQLRTGAFLPSAKVSYPSLLPLIGALPPAAVAAYPNGSLAFYKKLFDAIRQGYRNSGSAIARCAAAAAAAECAVHILVTMPNGNDDVDPVTVTAMLSEHLCFSLQVLADAATEGAEAATAGGDRMPATAGASTTAAGVLARLQVGTLRGSGLMAHTKEPWRRVRDFTTALLLQQRRPASAVWLAQLLAQALCTVEGAREAARRREGAGPAGAGDEGGGSAAAAAASMPGKDVGQDLTGLCADLLRSALAEAGSTSSEEASGYSGAVREGGELAAGQLRLPFLEPALVSFAATLLVGVDIGGGDGALWAILGASRRPLSVSSAVDIYFAPWFLAAAGAGRGEAAAAAAASAALLPDVKLLLRHGLARLPADTGSERFAALLRRCLQSRSDGADAFEAGGGGGLPAASAALKTVGSSSSRESKGSLSALHCKASQIVLDAAVFAAVGELCANPQSSSPDRAAAAAASDAVGFLQTCLGFWDGRVRDEPWLSEDAQRAVVDMAIGSEGQGFSQPDALVLPVVAALLPVLRAAPAAATRLAAGLLPLKSRCNELLVAAFCQSGIVVGMQQAWEANGAAALAAAGVGARALFVVGVAAVIRQRLDAAAPGKDEAALSSAVAAQLLELTRLDAGLRAEGAMQHGPDGGAVPVLLQVGLADAGRWQQAREEAQASAAEAAGTRPGRQLDSLPVVRRWRCLREMLSCLPAAENRLSLLLQSVPRGGGGDADSAGARLIVELLLAAVAADSLMPPAPPRAVVDTASASVRDAVDPPADMLLQLHTQALEQANCPALPREPAVLGLLLPATLVELSLTRAPAVAATTAAAATGMAGEAAASDSLKARCLYAQLLAATIISVAELLRCSSLGADRCSVGEGGQPMGWLVWDVAIRMRITRGLLICLLGSAVTDGKGFGSAEANVVRAHSRAPPALKPLVAADVSLGANILYVRRGPEGEMREPVTVIGVHSDGAGGCYYTVRGQGGRERQTVLDRLVNFPEGKTPARAANAARVAEADGWRPFAAATAASLWGLWTSLIAPHEQKLWKASLAEAMVGDPFVNSYEGVNGIMTLALRAVAPPCVRAMLLSEEGGGAFSREAALADMLTLQRRWSAAVLPLRPAVAALALSALSGCFAGTPLVFGTAGLNELPCAVRESIRSIFDEGRGGTEPGYAASIRSTTPAALSAGSARFIYAALEWVKDVCDADNTYVAALCDAADRLLGSACQEVVAAAATYYPVSETAIAVATGAGGGSSVPEASVVCGALAKAMAGVVRAEVVRVRRGGMATLSLELKALVVRWAVAAFLRSADVSKTYKNGCGGRGDGAQGLSAESGSAINSSCAGLLIELAADTCAAVDPASGCAAPTIALGRKDGARLWGGLQEGSEAALYRVMAQEASEPQMQASAFAVLFAVAIATNVPAAAADAASSAVAAAAVASAAEGNGDGINAGKSVQERAGAEETLDEQRDAALVRNCLPLWLLGGIGRLAVALEHVMDDEDGDGYGSDNEGGCGAYDASGGSGQEGSGTTAGDNDGRDPMTGEAAPLLLTWLLLLARRPALERAVDNAWAGVSAHVARLGVLGPLMRCCAHFLHPYLRQMQPLARQGALASLLPWELHPRDRGSDMAALALVVFSRTLHALPALVRTWWNDDCERRLRPWVASLAQRYVSPAVVQREAELIAAHNWDAEPGAEAGEMAVRASCVSREVTATYTKDECALEMTVSLPPNYPLRNVEVRCTRRLGIPEARWRRWVLQIVTLLSMQDGTVLDAVRLWKRNVDKEFEGMEPCVICYSILHPRDMALPGLECRTCANKFHASCLYQWFKSSGKSKCPLCQQTWV